MHIDRRIKPVLERPQPQKALNRLKVLTGKAIVFTHAFNGALAELKPGEEDYEITVDSTSPLAEHGLLHELIHAILFEEGYPCIETGYSNSADLTNAIQHPEVFPRMHDEFGLDMHPYYPQPSVIYFCAAPIFRKKL